MKIRAEQLNPVVGDIEGNLSLIDDALTRSERDGIDLLILSELVLTGYPPQDLLENSRFCSAIFSANQDLIRRTENTALLFGTAVPNESGSGRPLFNAALLCHKGQLLGQVEKTLLPNYDIFDELRYFEPNREIRTLELDGVNLGVTICEDLWYNETDHRVNPASELKSKGGVLLVNLSASPYARHKQMQRLAMLRRHALDLELPVIYSNQTGANGEIIFDGNSMAIDAEGRVVASAGGFDSGYSDVIWNPGEKRLTSVDESAVDDPGHSGRAEPDAGSGFGVGVGVGSGGSLPESEEDSPGSARIGGASLAATATPPLHDLPPGHFNRIFRAIQAGLRDYVRKSGMKNEVVLGLSGGLDSTLVAVLAAEAFGADRVTALMMPAEFSSEGSLVDSRKLAENLGLRTHLLPIQELFDGSRKILDPHFEGTPFGVAEENLQSRIRGDLLMAWSNKFGPMLLTTGNKSELAVGYSTLYGDMNGGLNPIGDLYKTEVFELSYWLNRDYYGKEVIPTEILEKPPSAELRPVQRDSDSLPDYEILDDILWRYIECRQEAVQIEEESGHDPKLIRRVLRQVDLSEFKRYQAPPILKLSPKSFGIGRRFPLVQGWSLNRS